MTLKSAIDDLILTIRIGKRLTLDTLNLIMEHIMNKQGFYSGDRRSNGVKTRYCVSK